MSARVVLSQHTSEIEYVFGTVSNYESASLPECTWSPNTLAFSDAVIAEWTALAHGRRPLSSDWQPFPSVFTLSEQGGGGGGVFPMVESQLCDLWDRIETAIMLEKFGK